MSGLKTLAVLTLMALAVPATALPRDPGDQLRFFATCTGRLSAQMEFQWLMSDPGADHTARLRANMEDLLDAIMPDDAGPRTLDLRIQAKFAHASLLTRSQFNSDPADADWARVHAENALAACTSALLG